MSRYEVLASRICVDGYSLHMNNQRNNNTFSPYLALLFCYIGFLEYKIHFLEHDDALVNA